jgi:transcriptional regulator
MSPRKNDALQGTLDLLVLKCVAAQGKLHGYAIASHIQTVSADLLRVEEGSLYPALHRMEQDGWLRAEWGITEKKRQARFYSITAEGKRQLAREEEGWALLTEGVQRVLRFA